MSQLRSLNVMPVEQSTNGTMSFMDIDEALNDPGLRTARMNATVYSTDLPALTPMSSDFQLKHPRRVRWSTFAAAPDSQWTHMNGFTDATPEEEAWYRINAPERGLHPDDLAAYRRSQRGPVAKFFDRLKFWP